MPVSSQFRITPETAATVVVTTSMYVAFVVLVRLVGQRSLTSLASFDFAAVVALGAVLGRTILLQEPTLMIGLLALATLFTLQGLLGMLRQNPRFDRLIHRPAVMLASNGRLLRDHMRAVHVVEDEIRQAVRRAGARSLDEVQCVVLERNGTLSVIRTGHDADPWLLEDVAGGDLSRER